MTRDEQWLLREKYHGEKTEVVELLNDFIAFQSRAKFEKKSLKTSEVNEYSLNECELIFAEFCSMTMQNDTQKKVLLHTHGEIVKEFIADCTRLLAGEPLAYIIGHIPFLNTTIHLASRPLIPRTETEFWTKHVIDEISTRGLPSVKILDLCAGSGCIGVAVLKALPQTVVDFVEIDTSHHPTIRTNIAENGVALSRTHIFGGNLFEKVTDTYDYILTNPPYIDARLDRTEKSVTGHEPALALWGGLDGMDIIRKILITSPQYLTEDGVLYIEHEPEQAEAIHEHGQRHFHNVETFTDQFGTTRFTRLSRPLK